MKKRSMLLMKKETIKRTEQSNQKKFRTFRERIKLLIFRYISGSHQAMNKSKKAVLQKKKKIS